MKKRLILFLLFTSFLFLPCLALADSCWDPVKGHCYPRIGLFHFPRGVNTPADWYARFQLVELSSTRVARDLKAISPNTIIINARTDWNTWIKDDRHPEWNVKDAAGNNVLIYGNPAKGTGIPLVDITDYCPVSTKSETSGMKYNEYIPDRVLEIVDLDFVDGVMSQGIWDHPYGTGNLDKYPNGVDLDRNGVNDWDEHGRAWLESKWLAGVNKAASKLKSKLGDKIFIINSGRFHDFAWEHHNGVFLEQIGPMYSFFFLKKQYDNFQKTAPEPHIILYGAKSLKDRTDYPVARFHGGVTAYGYGYWEVSDKGGSFHGGRSNEHHYTLYYDEFGLNLGWPTSRMQLIKGTGSGDKGTYVRFFDKGAVIVNVDHKPNSVSDSDIRSIEGYNGPYYRFLGGQDPDFNNGDTFVSVDLQGKCANAVCYGYYGDAIFLSKEPTVMVSDIFIDDDEEITSPGSASAVFSSEWIHDTCEGIDDAWCQGCRDYADFWALAYSESAESKAVFSPTINIAGDYEVFEWHGDVSGKDEASNVNHVVKHAGGENVVVVDQGSSVGRWNSLGVYSFDVGSGQGVTISAEDADGVVIADAVKFVFKNNHGNIKGLSDPPASCSELGGTPCQSDEECDGGSFSYSSDHKSLCCIGGQCQPIRFDEQTCPQMKGVPCQQGQQCHDGMFVSSPDTGNLCCLGGTCEDVDPYNAVCNGSIILKNELSVSSDGREVFSDVLDFGIVYLAEACGKFLFAKYAFNDSFADAGYSYVVPFGGTGWERSRNLLVGDVEVDWGNFSQSHCYNHSFLGDGTSMNFRILDEKYSDNQGSLSVSVYRCNPDSGLSFDLNSDGIVDIIDLILLVRAFGTSLHDLNGDGSVDVQDLLLIIKKL